MKPLSMTLKPICFAVLSAYSLCSHAALYEVIDLGTSTQEEVHNYALSGTSTKAEHGLIVGVGSIEGQVFIDHATYNTDLRDNVIVVGANDPDSTALPIEDFELTDDLLVYNSQYKGLHYGMYSDRLQEWTRVRVWDDILTETRDYTGTTNDYLLDTNDKQVMTGYGSAPYHIYKWTDENGLEAGNILREFTDRAFVYQVGDDPETGRVALMPEESEYGGWSRAVAISNSNIVIGSASVAVLENSKLTVEACLDTNVYPDVYCHQFAQYQVQAFAWRLNAQLETVETAQFGILFEPSDIYRGPYNSRLYAANINGYIVGQATGYANLVTPDERFTGDYAAIYTEFAKNDFRDTVDITDRELYLASKAVDINDSNIVVGEAIRFINGTPRTKAFYYDLNEEFNELTEMPSFFESSASTVKAINNQGVMIGEYEWEPRPSGVTRRRHAYAYQIGTDSLVDLNDAIDCNSTWEIVEANDIRDDGVILATALKYVPVLDSEGEPIFDRNGNEVQRLVARGVALKQIEGGIIEKCDNADQPFPEITRQGASMSWLLFGLPLLIFIRRLRKTN